MSTLKQELPFFVNLKSPLEFITVYPSEFLFFLLSLFRQRCPLDSVRKFSKTKSMEGGFKLTECGKKSLPTYRCFFLEFKSSMSDSYTCSKHIYSTMNCFGFVYKIQQEFSRKVRYKTEQEIKIYTGY